MASTNWFDYVATIVMLCIVVGIVVGVIYAVQMASTAVQSTKDSLKKQGVHLSENGMSIKTDKRLDRDDYVDATQRGLINALKASSYGVPGQEHKVPLDNPRELLPGKRQSVKIGLFERKKH